MFGHFAYKYSPVFVQNIALSFRSLLRKKLRENKRTIDLVYQLEGNERNKKNLQDFSKEKLEYVLKEAILNIPYYEKNSPKLTAFQFIDKNTLKQHSNAFVNTNHLGLTVQGSTSGTTGMPLVIPQNVNSVIREQAFVSRYLKWAGFKSGDRRAWLRGDVIVPIKQKKTPFWRYSYFEDMILLSSFHMTTDALPYYIKAMVDYKVNIIQAYPSSIVTLAKYLEANNDYYPAPLKSVITSSESLSREDRDLIVRRFNCPVFDWYGLFERVAAIGNCEHGRYHVFTDYSYVEFVPAGEVKGAPRAEIVGTNFNNVLYPLIRYKTGDYVILSDEQHCPCGRVYPIVESIEGRMGDYLIAESGQKVYILNHIPKGVCGLLASQFIQNSQNTITVLVVVNRDKFDKHQKQTLIRNVKDRLGHSMQVGVKEVEVIPRTSNGKVRSAICTI